jgi:hypothetical protein
MEDRERQLEIEGARRSRVALLAIAAGLLYLIGQILVEVLVASKQPTTGLLQGVAPALEYGQKAAAVDPRASIEHFLDHHALVIVIGWSIGAIALIALAWPLAYLFEAAAARGAPASSVTRALARYAAPAAGIISLVYEVALVIGAHDFVSGSAHGTNAFNADTGGGLRIAAGALSELTMLVLAVIFVLVALRAMRVGLVTRALGIIGVIGGVLFVIPIVPLPVVQAVFLVGIGLMLLERAGLVMPPAWPTGEAIPWVPAPRGGARGGRARGGTSEQRPRRAERSRGALAPVPTPPPSPSPSASKKRKRRHR